MKRQLWGSFAGTIAMLSGALAVRAYEASGHDGWGVVAGVAIVAAAAIAHDWIWTSGTKPRAIVKSKLLKMETGGPSEDGGPTPRETEKYMSRLIEEHAPTLPEYLSSIAAGVCAPVAVTFICAPPTRDDQLQFNVRFTIGQQFAGKHDQDHASPE